MRSTMPRYNTPDCLTGDLFRERVRIKLIDSFRFQTYTGLALFPLPVGVCTTHVRV
jgi:hypothetical protein